MNVLAFETCWPKIQASDISWSIFIQLSRRLHKDTTPPQPNHTVTPTHIEPEQYTHTQSQAPLDECTSIRNMLTKNSSKWHQLVYLYSTIKMTHGPINIRHIFMLNNLAPANRAVWKNMVEPDRPQMTIWRMRTACWITKATDTHSEYLILIAFT